MAFTSSKLATFGVTKNVFPEKIGRAAFRARFNASESLKPSSFCLFSGSGTSYSSGAVEKIRRLFTENSVTLTKYFARLHGIIHPTRTYYMRTLHHTTEELATSSNACGNEMCAVLRLIDKCCTKSTKSLQQSQQITQSSAFSTYPLCVFINRDHSGQNSYLFALLAEQSLDFTKTYLLISYLPSSETRFFPLFPCLSISESRSWEKRAFLFFL